MQAIRSPDMETVKRCRALDTVSMDCKIIAPQTSASQTNSSPLSSPLPRNVVAIPNTTPEKRTKESLWITFFSPCISMALA